MNRTVLIVEDEERMRHLLSDFLKRDGFNILEAENGYEGFEIFTKEKVDLIILDLMMPRLDGLSLCTKIRNHSNVLIIMLTAKSGEDDKLLGYELGADDYITKPFNPKVLVAKAKALLKRIEPLNPVNKDFTSSIFNVGQLQINSLSHDVYLDGEKLFLSPKEYDLLLYFSKNANIALSRDSILNEVWGFDYCGDIRTVDTHIKRLRQKLGEESDLIETVRGNGYKFGVK